MVKGGGVGVVLMSPSKEHVFAYKLDFPCSNNEAKYEALLVGLRVAKELGVKKLQVFGDSELVIK
jgi:ribonuclease HI